MQKTFFQDTTDYVAYVAKDPVNRRGKSVWHLFSLEKHELFMVSFGLLLFPEKNKHSPVKHCLGQSNVPIFSNKEQPYASWF